nr:centromere protein U-like [Oryctolagus cuniculus]
MAPPGRVRSRRPAGAVCSKNTLRRTHPMKEKAGQKHKPADVFEFPDNSEISSSGSESKKDDEPYETFGHKASLSKFKKFKIISCIFSDHNGMKMEISNSRICGTYANTWKLNKILLNEQWVIEEIKEN